MPAAATAVSKPFSGTTRPLTSAKLPSPARETVAKAGARTKFARTLVRSLGIPRSTSRRSVAPLTATSRSACSNMCGCWRCSPAA